jgi:hypothetical protein
LNIRT